MLKMKIGQGIYILSYLLNVAMKSLHSFFVGKVIYSSFHLCIMFTGLYVMYRGNLSLHTFFNIFFFIRKFSNFRICSNLVGFNRINSIVILLKDQNQLTKLRECPTQHNIQYRLLFIHCVNNK